MPLSLPNLDHIRTQDPKLAEVFDALVTQFNAVEQQTNSSAQGQTAAPPTINSVKVAGQNGHFQVAITDTNPIYRDVNYWVEHADNPQFSNPQIVHIGQSRNANLFLGSVTRYFRAYSSYGASPPSKPVFHGGAAAPLAVSGGGSIGGPAFQASQGSGTGEPGQGATGPGPVPFRTTDGTPPPR